MNKTAGHKEARDALLEEYRALNQMLWSRGSQTLSFMSLGVTGSLVLLAFVLANLPNLQQPLFASLQIAGFIPILGAIPVAFAILIEISSTKLDWHTLVRIHDIEETLGMEGHHGIYAKVRTSLLYRIRQRAWRLFLWLVMLVNFYCSYWVWFVYTPPK
jgi:hypothetical protein